MIKEKEVLLQAVQEAGRAIVALQETGFSVTRKANNDLLTQADLLANDILKCQLLGAFPEYGWLSEESVDDAARLSCARVWVVDPIDGTKEYASGIPEYAISVALVEHGIPLLACVYNPVRDELYHAVQGQGAWRGQEALHCRPAANPLVLLASRSEYARGEWESFKAHSDVRQVGSIAYKLALIAAGEADATFSLGPKSEWDIAAGVLLVKEAGGMATDQLQHEFVFNQKQIRVNGIVACGRALQTTLFELINERA